MRNPILDHIQKASFKFEKKRHQLKMNLFVTNHQEQKKTFGFVIIQTVINLLSASLTESPYGTHFLVQLLTHCGYRIGKSIMFVGWGLVRRRANDLTCSLLQPFDGFKSHIPTYFLMTCHLPTWHDAISQLTSNEHVFVYQIKWQ